jgi:hypothetical protein
MKKFIEFNPLPGDSCIYFFKPIYDEINNLIVYFLRATKNKFPFKKSSTLQLIWQVPIVHS